MKLNPDDLLAIVLSLAVHVLVAALLWFGAPDLFKPEARQVVPVKAVFLDTQRQISAAQARQQAEAERQRQLEAERLRKAEELRKQREKDARLKAEAEAKRKEAEARQKAELEAKRKAEAEAKKRAEAEAKLRAEEQARQDALQKKKAAEEAARKKAAEEAERQKAEIARKKRQEDNKRRLQEALLAEEAALEEQRRASAQAKQDDSDRTRYIEQLSQHIQRHWARPVGADQDFSCKIQIRQLPGGQIQSYELLESCGNSFLDASVESAIRKADPLPLPKNKRVFERTLNLTFKP